MNIQLFENTRGEASPGRDVASSEFSRGVVVVDKLEVFNPSPPSAHCFSMPLLILHNQTRMKTGVLMSTLSTG